MIQSKQIFNEVQKVNISTKLKLYNKQIVSDWTEERPSITHMKLKMANGWLLVL